MEKVDKPARKKRLCSYNKSWEEKFTWVNPVRDAPMRAFCNLCRREFSISHGGEHDLTQHVSTEIHKKTVHAKGTSNIRLFFANTSTRETDQEAASEASYVFHTISHGLSYNSTDCLSK